MARPTLDIDFMGQHIENDKENVKKKCLPKFVRLHTDKTG